MKKRKVVQRPCNQAWRILAEVQHLILVNGLPFVGPDKQGKWPTCQVCGTSVRYVYRKQRKLRCYTCIFNAGYAKSMKKGR